MTQSDGTYVSPPHPVEYYEREEVVAEYARRRSAGLSARETRAVDSYFPDSGRLLDLGCGAGRTTVRLADRGYDVVAVDVSSAMVSQTDAATAAACAVGDAARLPFASDAFDCALFSHNGLDELRPTSARIAALSEVERVLRPGGRFAFSARNLLRQLVPWPISQTAIRDRLQFWGGNARAGRLGTSYKLVDGDVERGKLAHFGDPLSEYRLLRAVGFDVLAMLRNDGWPSAVLGPSYFAVAEVPE